MHVHQLKSIPFNKDIYWELKKLLRLKGLNPFYYTKFDHDEKGKDERLRSKKQFGWWDEVIPMVLNSRTFSLSEIDFNYDIDPSYVWSFYVYAGLESYETDTVLFEISMSEFELIEIPDLSVRSGTIILDKSYLFDTCNIADKTVNWMKRTFNGPLICL